MKHSSAYSMVAAAGALWGIIAVFVRALNAAGFSAMQVVFVRVAFSAALLVLFLAIKDRGALRIRLRDLWCFVGTGIVSIVFFNYCYFTTIETSSVAVAALLLYTSPVFVMLFSLLLFGERFTLRKGAALVCTVLGCACVTGVLSGSGPSMRPAALLTGLGAGLFYALYTVFSKFALRRYRPVTVTAYTFLVAAVGSAPFSDLPAVGERLMRPGALPAVLAMAAICTVLPFLFYTTGVSKIPAAHAAVIATVEPAVAALVGTLYFRDPFTGMTMAGIALIAASILIMNLRCRPPAGGLRKSGGK